MTIGYDKPSVRQRRRATANKRRDGWLERVLRIIRELGQRVSPARPVSPIAAYGDYDRDREGQQARHWWWAPPLMRRHSPLHFLEPVLHEDKPCGGRRRVRRAVRLCHQKPLAVGCDVALATWYRRLKKPGVSKSLLGGSAANVELLVGETRIEAQIDS
jgi:hypothetical protein